MACDVAEWSSLSRVMRARSAATLLKAALQAHRKRQILAQGEALATALVFPATEKGKTGWRRRASSLRNKLVRAGKRAGLEIRVTPQVLRRTYNTLQRGRGIDKLALLELMGHSSEDMTARYFAARDAVRREAVEGFEGDLGAPLRLVVGDDGT